MPKEAVNFIKENVTVLGNKEGDIIVLLLRATYAVQVLRGPAHGIRDMKGLGFIVSIGRSKQRGKLTSLIKVVKIK